MEFPLISSEAVFLGLFETRSVVSSQSKETTFLFPLSHSEVSVRSGHLLKLCDFSIR